VLKIAVAGCGRLAVDVHLPTLAALRDVEVVAVVDPDLSRRELALRIYPRARAFTRSDDLWEALHPDALIVSTPTALHVPLALEAVRRGVPVYLEKPIAHDLAEAGELVRVWKAHGGIGMIGFNYRFHPLFVSARRLLSEGAVGKPLIWSSVFASSLSPAGDWRGSLTRGGGVLLDLGSHHVDLVHFLFGESAERVHAQTSSLVADCATATLQMKMRSGLLASCCCSFGTADQDRIEIFGDRGILRVDRNLSTACEVIPHDRPRARLRQVSSSLSFLWRPNAVFSRMRAPGNDPSHALALMQFAQAVRSGTPATPDLNDGYRALEVIAAAQQSVSQGTWVNVAHSGSLA
jgi:predicted dehydrogenase